MKKIFAGLSAMLSLLFAFGCSSTPSRLVTPHSAPPYQANSEVTKKRIATFRSVTASIPLRGVGIFPAAFKGRVAVKDVGNFISALGFNRVFCYITSETELDDFMKEMLSELSSRKLPAELVVLQYDFFRRRTGNQLIRPFLKQYPTLKEAVEKAVEFNNDLPEKNRFSGITVGISPHCIDGVDVNRAYGSLYRWGEKTYGIGGDNDMLMRDAMRQLKEISALPGLPPLRIAIPDFYHELAASGKISVGTIADFSKISPRLMIVNSGNKPSQVAERVTAELNAAPKGTSLAVAILLAEHTSVGEGHLRRRDWNDFVNAMKFAASRHKSYPAYEGFAVGPFAIVEYLLEEE